MSHELIHVFIECHVNYRQGGWSYGQTVCPVSLTPHMHGIECSLLQWFREQEYLQDGKYSDLDSFVETWENSFLAWDANDILTLMHTWFHGNIATVKDGGDLAKALNSIKAKGLIMPSKTDFYFPVSITVIYFIPHNNVIQIARGQ